ncbi:unnamed protein product, partial [Iphiclides podalirius]
MPTPWRTLRRRGPDGTVGSSRIGSFHDGRAPDSTRRDRDLTHCPVPPSPAPHPTPPPPLAEGARHQRVTIDGTRPRRIRTTKAACMMMFTSIRCESPMSTLVRGNTLTLLQSRLLIGVAAQLSHDSTTERGEKITEGPLAICLGFFAIRALFSFLQYRRERALAIGAELFMASRANDSAVGSEETLPRIALE